MPFVHALHAGRRHPGIGRAAIAEDLSASSVFCSLFIQGEDFVAGLGHCVTFRNGHGWHLLAKAD